MAVYRSVTPLKLEMQMGPITSEVYHSHAYLTLGCTNDQLRVSDVNSNGNFANCQQL